MRCWFFYFSFSVLIKLIVSHSIYDNINMFKLEYLQPSVFDSESSLENSLKNKFPISVCRVLWCTFEVKYLCLTTSNVILCLQHNNIRPLINFSNKRGTMKEKKNDYYYITFLTVVFVDDWFYSRTYGFFGSTKCRKIEISVLQV